MNPTGSRRRTFSRTVRNTLAANVMLGVAFTIVAANPASIVPDEDKGPATPPPPVVEIERVERLIDRHGCWTADEPQPADVWIPGHVIVTNDLGTSRYAGPRAVGLALEGKFSGTVYAYCR